jgi:hypothetical protein
MNKQLDVNDWVAMFRDIGLDPTKMQQSHRLFEARHPAGHQSFLEWLGLKCVDKQMWIELLAAAGMDQSAMSRWHHRV